MIPSVAISQSVCLPVLHSLVHSAMSLKGTVLKDMKEYLDNGEVNQTTLYRWRTSWEQGKPIKAQASKQAALMVFMTTLQQCAGEMDAALKKIGGNVEEVKKPPRRPRRVWTT